MEVGRYRILEAIGRGGMAEVYRAVAIGPEGFEKEVVVKRILPRLANKPDLARMIVDEAKIASRLDHPNIVQIVDLGTIDDEFFLVMELVRGMDLGRVVKQLEARGEHIPLGTGLRIVAEVCRALDYAHRQVDAGGRPLGIVHRDVSPQNVLLSSEGAVKLGDFGIARAAGVGGQTETGLLKGKVGYVAPEQVLDTGVDGRTDLYACGIVLYEMLTGSHPFATRSDAETLRRARHPEIRPPSLVRPALDPHLDDLVMRALEIDPGARYATGAEMLHAIEAYLRDHAIAVTATDIAALVRQATLGPSQQEAPIDLDGIFADEIERLGADESSGLSRFTRTRDLAPGETASADDTSAAGSREVAVTAATRRETPAPTTGSLVVLPQRARWPWLAAGGAVIAALVAVGAWAGVGGADGADGADGAGGNPGSSTSTSTTTTTSPTVEANSTQIATPIPTPTPSPSPSPSPSPTPTPTATPDASPEIPRPAPPTPIKNTHPRPVRDAGVTPPPPPPPPPPPATPGTLRVGSAPHWARVAIDGVVRGTTPLVIELPAGPHTVVATNPELGRTETKRVNVAAGGSTSVRFDPF